MTDNPRPDPKKSWLGVSGKELANLGRLSGLGVTMAASIVAFGAGGYWLDRTLGTLPVFLILGVFVGATGGFLHILKNVR